MHRIHELRPRMCSIIRLLRSFSICLILVFAHPAGALSQGAPGVLELKPEDWGIRDAVFHIMKVEDNRKNTSSVGTITGNGPAQQIRFKADLSSTMLPYIQQCLAGDTAKVGLILGFNRFALKETRAGQRRTIVFDFLLEIYREADGERVKLYEVGGTPSYVVHGPNPDIYDRLIGGSLKQVLNGFDRWSKENRKQPTLCKTIYLSLTDDGAFRDTTSGDTLRWSKAYQLKWPDFKGPADEQVDFSANSSCLFAFSSRPDYRGDTLVLELILHPALTKTTSWVKADKKSPELLAHEQLHFDICELYGRRMRERLLRAKAGVLNYDAVLRGVFDEEWHAYKQRQVDYDSETAHGLISEKQAMWTELIKKELSALDRYASE